MSAFNSVAPAVGLAWSIAAYARAGRLSDPSSCHHQVAHRKPHFYKWIVASSILHVSLTGPLSPGERRVQTRLASFPDMTFVPCPFQAVCLVAVVWLSVWETRRHPGKREDNVVGMEQVELPSP